MSRKLFAFLLSELKIVRLICKNQNCGAIIEAPIEKMGYSSVFGECRVCGASLGRSGDPKNPFALLADAIKQLRAADATLDIEFVLPDDGE